ncbi:MAG: hypothetical protein P8M30_13185 [Planctomycetaceae bacterium]|nr:hypothetical protein [Planctomycetaceae bacterium]MDC0308575.1 hypothetical protein [Planctomycetaceae bacterium]MDG2390262.1 hypothetical protein [Planctomycetaceae bacterium]
MGSLTELEFDSNGLPGRPIADRLRARVPAYPEQILPILGIQYVVERNQGCPTSSTFKEQNSQRTEFASGIESPQTLLPEDTFIE